MPVMSSSSWSLYVNHIFNLCDYDNGTLKWVFLSIAYCYRVEPLTLLILYLSYVLWSLTLLILYLSYVLAWTIYWTSQWRIQDFKLGGGGGGALKKIAPSGGRRENFLGISCEKSRFYAKKIRFFPNAEGSAKIFGVFRVKNHDFTPKNLIFSNPPPLNPPLRVASPILHRNTLSIEIGHAGYTLKRATNCFWGMDQTHNAWT